MYKVYCGKIFTDKQVIELLRPNLNGPRWGLWNDKIPTLSQEIVSVTDKPDEADFFLFPHDYNQLLSEVSYITEFAHDAEIRGKKVVIFFPGDRDTTVVIPNAIIFRNSQYKNKRSINEIMLPGYVEDMGKGGVSVREKSTNGMPAVGFCGWADFKTIKQRISLTVKVCIGNFKMLLGEKDVLPRRQGLWWRRKILPILSKSRLVTSNFIIRTSYSGNEKTIALDPERARKEYVENIVHSDFTLCVKGDGNFSTRFYETLSLGRVPLFVDTDCPLPLEGVIDYSKFVFRVNYTDYKRLPELLSAFYHKCSPEEWKAMQKRAREVFENYLRMDSFLKYTFTKEFLGKYLKG